MLNALQIAENAFFAVVACLLFAQFSPWRRPAMAAVMASIFLASAGTTAFCLDAFEGCADQPGVSPFDKWPGQDRDHNLFGAGAKFAQDGVEDEGDEDDSATGENDGEPKPSENPASGKIESARS